MTPLTLLRRAADTGRIWGQATPLEMAQHLTDELDALLCCERFTVFQADELRSLNEGLMALRDRLEGGV